MAQQTIVNTSVNQWGNGLAVRLNSQVAKTAGVTEGTPVKITAEPGRVIVETIPKRMTLEERLAVYDVDAHGGEAMPFEPVGREVI